MGSLMSGWSSRVQDPRKAKFMRNSSQTREEIDAYWKSKKNTEEDHIEIESISPSSSLPTTPCSYTSLHTDDHGHQESEAEKILFRRSASMPIEQTSSKELHDVNDQLTIHPPFKKKTCWWTASKWAFLNEPPVLNNNEASEKHRRTSSYEYTPDKSYRESAAGLISSSTKPDTRITT